MFFIFFKKTFAIPQKSPTFAPDFGFGINSFINTKKEGIR